MGVNFEHSLLDGHPIFESVVMLYQGIVGDGVQFESGRKGIRKYGTEGSEHVVESLPHQLRVGHNNEFRLNSRLNEIIEPCVLDFCVKELELVFNFGLAEDKLYFFCLFSNVSVEELF